MFANNSEFNKDCDCGPSSSSAFLIVACAAGQKKNIKKQFSMYNILFYLFPLMEERNILFMLRVLRIICMKLKNARRWWKNKEDAKIFPL